MGINTRHILIVALGYNDYLHNEIDRIYEENRWTYYEEFKSSGFYNDMVIKSFTTGYEEKMKKVAGIVEWCYNHNDLSLVHRLIKKGYKDVLRYYEQNKNNLDLQQFMYFILKRRGMKVEEMTELKASMYQSVLLYLVYTDGYNVNKIFNNPYGKIVLQGIKNLREDLLHPFIIQKQLKESELDNEKAVNLIKETLRIDVNKKIPINLDKIFDVALDIRSEEILAEKGLSFKTADIQTSEKVRSSLFQEEVFKHIGGYSGALKLSELNYFDLLSVEFSKDELLMLAHSALNIQQLNSYDDKEKQQYLISTLFLHALVKQYKLQKEHLINDTQESWYLDVKQREKQIEEKEKDYRKETDKLTTQNEEGKRRIQELKDKNKELEKELERLRKQVAETKDEKEELIELRNFAYNQKRVDVEVDALSVKEAADLLNTRKIIVCGGHPNMQQRLKEWLPNLETMSTDTLGKNFNYLRNYDVVYFYPNYANHSFYKKIKTTITNSKTKFVYLPDKDNVEKLLLEMHESINE